MQKQLNKMWDIEQQQNDSKTEQQILTQMPQTVKHKLKLVRLGTDDPQSQQQYKQPKQLDLDSYLQLQKTKLPRHKPKPIRKTAQQLQKQKQYKQGYGKGFKMLEKMGFNIGKGLGKNQQGRTNIVQAQFKTSLTKRDQQYEQEQQRIRLKQQQQQQKKQQINPYSQFKFEQIFQYRSKIPALNMLLINLKNKYESYKSKLDLLTKQTASFDRDLQVQESLKLQKTNQVKQIQQQINGLQQIQKSTNNIQKYPHLAISYNADLLIVKEIIDKLMPVSLNKLVHCMQKQIKKGIQALNVLYLAKQKQSLKAYSQTSTIEIKMKQMFKKNQYKGTKNGKNNIDFNKFEQKIQQQLITISQTDLEKIKKFTKAILQQTVLANKLEPYLTKCKDIRHCDQYIIDLIQVIKHLSKQLCAQIKQKYLIPLANAYLCNFRYQAGAKKLPHLVIIPWMMIINVQELQIMKFINNLMGRLWTIQNEELYNIIVPWYKYMSAGQQAYFINLYLAPRILYEMQNFSFDSKQGGHKQKIKGFIKYCQLMPIKMREQIIQNSIGLTILYHYKKQLADANVNNNDLKTWVGKWTEKMDKICEGSIKKIFVENNVLGIF